MLTGLNQQIVTAYDTLDMTIEEIATEFDFDILSVKACLMQFSRRFKDEIKEADDKSVEFDNAEMEESKETILYLMRHAEDEHLKGRMAKYIRDDKKGRLDALSGLKSLNVNIALFNERLLQARAAKEKSKEKSIGKQIEDKKTVDIEAEVVDA